MSPKTFIQSETQRKKFMHEQRQIKQLWPQGSQDGGQTLHPLAKFFTVGEHFERVKKKCCLNRG